MPRAPVPLTADPLTAALSIRTIRTTLGTAMRTRCDENTMHRDVLIRLNSHIPYVSVRCLTRSRLRDILRDYC